MLTRAVEIEEYRKIMKLLHKGFKYVEDGQEKTFRKNERIALALMLEANLGLKITDILKLKVLNFNGNTLETKNKKTGQIQSRPINKNIVEVVKQYVEDRSLQYDDYLIDIKIKTIQKQIRIICKYLDLQNISTNSFRKLFATTQFKNNNYNLEIVKELLNHSSIETTQKYIGASKQPVNEASENFFIE